MPQDTLLAEGSVSEAWQAGVAFALGGGTMPLVIGGLSFALAVGILVTTLTRWGASRPLVNCVLLSVVAHLLLLAVLTTSRWLTAPPPPGRPDEPFRITMVGPLPAFEDSGDGPARQPWEHHHEATGPAPDVATILATGPITGGLDGGDPSEPSTELAAWMYELADHLERLAAEAAPPKPPESQTADSQLEPPGQGETSPAPSLDAELAAHLAMWTETPPMPRHAAPAPSEERSEAPIAPRVGSPLAPADLPDEADAVPTLADGASERDVDAVAKLPVPPMPTFSERSRAELPTLDRPRPSEHSETLPDGPTLAETLPTQDIASMLAGTKDLFDLPPPPESGRKPQLAAVPLPDLFGEGGAIVDRAGRADEVRLASRDLAPRIPAPPLPEPPLPAPWSEAGASDFAGGSRIVEGRSSALAAASRLHDARRAIPARSAMPRLGDGGEVPGPFRLRVSPERSQVIRDLGGTDDSEAAVVAALDFLAAVQNKDGSWSATLDGGGREERPFQDEPTRPGVHAETGMTGLALLAFLGRGETHFEGPHRHTVRRGLLYLTASQRSDGNLAGNASLFASMYCHAMATLALGEALALSGDQTLRPAVERAIGFTVASQDRRGGGWRYIPGDRGDTSQFGWQILAIETAEQAGVSVPAETKARAIGFLRSVITGRDRGLASYRPEERPSHTMTAEALVCRAILDVERGRDAWAEAAENLLSERPSRSTVNYYDWYYSTLAARRFDRTVWRTWFDDLRGTLLTLQEVEGRNRGSWAPDRVWGGYGGRVYSTALAALCLESVYRFDLPMPPRPE